MVLYKTQIVDALQSSSKRIEIESSDKNCPFDLDSQISDVAIDLRLGYKGYILSEDVDVINSLNSGGFKKYFIEKDITETGYTLEPGEIIFCSTLEMVKIQDRNLLGFLCGRYTYVRMGLSITCDPVKIPYGYKSVIGLQIQNNTHVPIMIFARQKLAQILFAEVSGAEGEYTIGPYGKYSGYLFPTLTDDEKKPFSEIEWDNIQKIKSKNKYIVPRDIQRKYLWLKKYHKIKLSIWVAYLTGCVSGLVLPYILNPVGNTNYYKIITIAGIIMLVLIAIDLIVDYAVFTKNIKGEDDE